MMRCALSYQWSVLLSRSVTFPLQAGAPLANQFESSERQSGSTTSASVSPEEPHGGPGVTQGQLMAVMLVQCVSVHHQGKGTVPLPIPTPRPRELSNIVTVSWLCNCKVTPLHHCDGAPQSSNRLALYISYISMTGNASAVSLSPCEDKTRRGEEGQRVERTVETLMQVSECVCNMCLFDADCGVQSIPLIQTGNLVLCPAATCSELWPLVQASCCDERQLPREKLKPRNKWTHTDLQHTHTRGTVTG